MSSSLAIAAPPLLFLLVLLWSLDRHAGRSGLVLVLSFLWGGLGATAIVTLVGSLWVEQPSYYPFAVAPAVEELAKGSLFVALVPLGLLTGAPLGMAYGLACGLGFAIWENGAYFEQYGLAGPPTLLYVARTAGAALLHGLSTALVGAAAGVGGLGLRRVRRAAALLLAVALAVGAHSAWNYVCLVLADTSALRRVLPVLGLTALVVLLVLSVLGERRALRLKMLALWQDNVVPEPVAKALLSPRPVKALRAAGIASPRRLVRAAFRLAMARRQVVEASPRRRWLRARAEKAVTRLAAVVETLAANGRPPRDRAVAGRIAVPGVALGAAVLLHFVGQMSPVPAALARRTVVVAAGLEVRPEPLVTVTDSGTYALWLRKGHGTGHDQILSWVGPGPNRHRMLKIGALPQGRDTWYEMTALGRDVVVGTRQGDQVKLRTFQEGLSKQTAFVDAPETSEDTACWPWLSSDLGKTIVAWDRLRRAAWLVPSPLGAGPPVDLPDPFQGIDEGEQGCFRGLMLVDDLAYEVARPEGNARIAAVRLDTLEGEVLSICPDREGLRIHSMDKDAGQVLVLLGAPAEGGYSLWLARLDRRGNVVAPCRHLRTMPAGAPDVVGLAGADDDAFLAWSTGTHVLLARLPIARGSRQRERRWVLDRAPSGGPAVVRIGVVDRRLYVTWEGPSPGGTYSIKLLRTEIDDLP